MSAPRPEDRSAGYIGLVVSATLLVLILGGIVKWTNIIYEGHGPAAAAAEHK